MIDTHVHLDDPAFDLDDRRDLWRHARDAGVEAAIAVGVAPATWSRTIAVARALDDVVIALGIHPQVVPTLTDAEIDEALRALPAQLDASAAVAVGECGLDGPSGDLDRQERVLRAHLAIARAMDLPVSLHVFGAHGRALALLRDVGARPSAGVLHSYSGPAELVREYAKLGWSFGFAGAVSRSNARRPVLAARAVPRDLLLAETDAPFQPVGADARDRPRGDPRDLGAVIAAIARARGEEPSDVARTTTENARALFGLAGHR